MKKILTPDEIRTEYTKTYDKGFLNHIIRTWYYLQKGLTLMNDFKYLLAGIIAFYYALKLDSIWWMVAIFLIAMPVLIIVGYFHTHKMAKALEWTSMVFASYFSRYNVDLAEKNIENTSEIAKELKEIKSLINQWPKK